MKRLTVLAALTLAVTVACGKQNESTETAPAAQAPAVTTPEAEKSATQRGVEADLARLAEAAIARDFPVLYTCYGIGVLTRVLGGRLGTRYAEPADAIEITLTAEGAEDPLVGVLPERFHAFGGHKEAADELPPEAVLLASSASCPTQVYRVGRRVYATQFHPEVTAEDFIARGHVYRHHGYFAADALEEFSARVASATVTEPRRMLRRFVELADADTGAADAATRRL